MAWSTLPTYVSGNALTAAQMNAIADNIEESAAAKATAAGQYFIATATNTLAARLVSQDITSNSDSDTQTSFDDIANLGPTVVMTCQIQALIWIQAHMANATTSTGTHMSMAVSGATTTAADEERGSVWQGTAGQGERWGVANLYTLTAGSNTFRSKYKVQASTGTWKDRRMSVMGF